jgi:hypothetical protein
MASLEEVGERDGWRCWVCDQAVDPEASVNDDRGPSLDRCEVFAKPVSKKKAVIVDERLAHRMCNTKKGAIKPVIAWPSELILFDPAPIVQSTERLVQKGGRELIARCASKADATTAARWIEDRLSRLVPDVAFTTKIDEGGGQFLLSLIAPRP